MGFDQYHEPREELPAETQTFARLCASLTEEAEAIGWYEQRLAIEPDRDAQAIMRDAQGERDLVDVAPAPVLAGLGRRKRGQCGGGGDRARAAGKRHRLAVDPEELSGDRRLAAAPVRRPGRSLRREPATLADPRVSPYGA